MGKLSIKTIYLMIVTIVLCITIYPWFIPAKKPIISQGAKVIDSHGELITTILPDNRVEVPLSRVSIPMKQAIIAVEDERFYSHTGIDYKGLARAIWRNFSAGKVVEGGSTITQQVAKNLYLTSERTLSRKFLEALLAIRLEYQYGKDQILEMYLNHIYFGHGAYGIERAAQIYFGKTVAELNLAESALLAGLPRAPSFYSPFDNWLGAKERQRIVLSRMVELNLINHEEKEEAINYPLKLANKPIAPVGSYFIDEVRRYIIEKYPDGENLLYNGGLTIHTTLDLKAQKAAEKAIDEGMKGKDENMEVALIAIEPSTGQIKAMVGGRNYYHSQFNRALRAKRQPGSTFKPFLYAAALERGYTQATLIDCQPVDFPLITGEVYHPTDYGSNPYHYRPMTLKEAVAVSDNIVAVRLTQELSPYALVNMAYSLGIKSSLKPYLSLPLGTSSVNPLELAAANAVFFNGGKKIEPYFIEKIIDSRNRVLEENHPKTEMVLEPKISYLVTDMLMGVFEPGGTASHLTSILQRPAAGKTGTTEGRTDAWFLGATPELCSAVFVGYDNPAQAVGLTGGGVAGPIWAQFTKDALSEVEKSNFNMPPGIIQESICEDSGYLANEYCPRPKKMSFIDGTQPWTLCYIHNSLDLWGPETPERINEMVPEWVLDIRGPNSVFE